MTTSPPDASTSASWRIALAPKRELEPPRPDLKKNAEARTGISVIDYARAPRCNFDPRVFQQRLRDRRFRTAACAPKAAIREIRPRSATARVDLRSSRVTRRFCRVTGPPISARAGQANLIENTPDYGVNDRGDGIWPAVERRNGGQHNRPSLEQDHGISRMN